MIATALRRRRGTASLLLAGALPAAVGLAALAAPAHARLWLDNGLHLDNGTNLNGLHLDNGLQLNGREVRGLSLDGVILPDAAG
jgi:hypothetical protein